ncbi:hypothetical protein B0H17DRAFT_1101191 [Mycena rosella]|uniref:Uncharacterized protein n=1 Tax=Mycena rosella TaxID=1033263 RepID=A0AAD7CM54_MYCRO|nr:hypothetical protein B0H17DRAFT_1101191 [Mycena rosella]
MPGAPGTSCGTPSGELGTTQAGPSSPPTQYPRNPGAPLSSLRGACLRFVALCTTS